MKKLKKILIIASLILVVGACTKKQEVTSNPEETKPQEIINKTEEIQGDIKLSAITIDQKKSSNIIKGTATNTGKEQEFRLEVRIYNKESGRAVGVQRTEKMKLKAEEAKEFEVEILGTANSANEFKVTVIK